MKYLGKSSADEVVLEWLRAELGSTRFSGDLKSSLKHNRESEAVITSPNLNSRTENKARLSILLGYSWLDFDLYKYSWQKIEFGQDDVRGLHYIDYSYWNELSENTREVGRAVQNVLDGKVVFDVPHDRFYDVANDFESGKEQPPIILISNSNSETSEIVEGHLRATGYVLARKVNRPLRGILGTLAEQVD